MTPSERTKHIKLIARELNKEEYGIIDLTLKQFKLPTSDLYSGTKIGYIIQQIEDADEKTLIDLASHLNDVSIAEKESDINPNFWKEGFLKLFISHLATDKINAKSLQIALENYSITSFVAHTDIEPTKQWQDEIELALRTSDALTALMVDGFHKSNWTDQEIGIALGRDLLIIPVRMGTDPYGFIGKFQAITFKDIDKLAEGIFKSLISNKKTNKKMAYAIIHKFENTNSYSEAKKNIELVSQIEYWDRKLKRKLVAASDNNSQIKESFGVVGRVKNIIKEFEDKYDV